MKPVLLDKLQISFVALFDAGWRTFFMQFMHIIGLVLTVLGAPGRDPRDWQASDWLPTPRESRP